MFCFAIDPAIVGQMAAIEPIKRALRSAEALGTNAAALQALDPPKGWLAVANKAEDLGSGSLEALLWAAIIAQELQKGTSYEVANALWQEQVSARCDSIKAGIRTVREQADSLP